MSEIIKDKVALITGGASGIGLAYAKELLRNGLKGVAIADLAVEKGLQVVKDLEREYGASIAIFVKTDVRNKLEFEEAFKDTIKAFQQLDIVINSAAVFNDVRWEDEIAVNINGVIYGCLLALENYLPKFKSGPEGVIVNTASVAGLTGVLCMPIYAATKHAIVGLGMSLGRSEHYEKTKLRILTICPSFACTPKADEIKNKQLGPRFAEFAQLVLNSHPQQKPEFVGKGLIKVLNEGKSGTIWVIEEEQPAYEVVIPPWNELCVSQMK